MNNEPVYLLYDHDCPFCRNYCQMAKIQETVGQLLLIDARKPSKLLDEINAKGLDIDHGMALKYKNTIYYGADAIHALTLMSTQSDIFNKMAYAIFHSSTMSKILYPILKNIRLFSLWVMDIPLINNVNTESEKDKNND